MARRNGFGLEECLVHGSVRNVGISLLNFEAWYFVKATIAAGERHGKSESDVAIRECLASITERRQRMGEAMVKKPGLMLR